MRNLTAYALLLAAPLLAAEAEKPTNHELFTAIREGRCETVKGLLQSGVSASARDKSGTTPLMHAALYSGASCMKALLAKGANPNDTNDAGATALMWAVHDPAMVKVLLEAGADPNARSKEGRTPLLIAARQAGSMKVIRMLVGKGADPKAKDQLGGTALMLAAEAGDMEMVKYFVERGVDINAKAHPLYGKPRFDRVPEGMEKAMEGASGITALMSAAKVGEVEVVRYLLDKGADAKAVAFMGLDALKLAAVDGNFEIARMLIAAGADINSREFRGATPLILAASADETRPELIRLLIDSGADVQAKDARGLTAYNWARKRGDTQVARLLGTPQPKAAAVMPVSVTQPRSIRDAVESSVALLQTSSSQFIKKSGCISCHNQSLPAMAVAAARERGFHVNEDLARQTLKFTMAVVGPHRDPMMQGVPTIPASTIVSTYALMGVAVDNQPADESTDALVHELAARQRLNGRWATESGRPPLGQGDITATALTIRALQLYPLPGRKAEFEKRIARGRAWLVSAKAITTQEKTMRLFGLTWASAEQSVIREAAAQLMAEQRADGGWAQLPLIDSDAYATGMVLNALADSGMLSPVAAAYQRGVQFLISTQNDDGSWHVKTRALGFQPYFESGYPHGHDQWISAAGSAWATMALTRAVDPRTSLASR